MVATAQEVTRLLIDWSNGDQTALDSLMPLVYDELRRLAHHYLNKERSGHTLQTTALVNEAYFRLVDCERIELHGHGRRDFFALASQLMRRILVDYARSRRRAKRGGKAIK